MSSVEIVEVGPRDGLQNESTILSTEDKIRLIRRLADAGVSRMEVVSFAHPKSVPQLDDAEAVLAGLTNVEGLSRIGLVLNERGMDRAERCDLDEVNFVVLATDLFSERNQGMATKSALAAWKNVAERARAGGLRTSVTIGAAFGCPFQGEVPAGQVLAVVEAALEGRPDEIALADTIGVAVPAQVEDLVDEVCHLTDVVRCHFHNTRNTGYANIFAALRAGAHVMDASVGGYGGCPFSPSATGNVATEDSVYALERSGFATGLDLAALTDTSRWLEERLQRPYPAMLGRAAAFPP